MSKLHASVLSGVMAAVLLVACASVDSFVKQADEASAPVVVHFNYDAVEPATVTIPSDGNVMWINDSLDDIAFVIFPSRIAASLRCTELRPYLTKLQDGRYRSPPLTGTVTERAQLPCTLAPGTYDYQVWLMGNGFGFEGAESVKPQKALRATLVVSKPPPPPPAAPPAQAAPPALPGGY